MAQQIGNFTVTAIKDELVETIQLLPRDCIQGRLAERIVDFAVPPIKEELAEASASGAHPRAHLEAYSGILCATQIEEKLAEVFSTSTSTLWNRACQEAPWSEAAQG